MKSIHGRLLHINLSARNHEAIPLPDSVFKKFLGGRSLGAKLLLDYLPARIDPLSPDCPFFLLTGPTTGTLVPNSGKYVIIGKSPLTGGFLDSYSSGYLAAEIKYAGWDGLMVSGRCDYPCYLWIKDDQVEIRDASHIWGNDTFTSEDMIRAETDPRAGTCVIGVAGEKQVLISLVNSDHYRQAARGGTGALFGSKNLKGIAVYGTQGLDIAAKDTLLLHHAEIVEMSNRSIPSRSRKRFGTPLTMNITNKANMLPTRNFQESHMEEAVGKIDAEGCEPMTVRSRGCWGCMMACSKISKADDSDPNYAGEIVEGPEYETNAIFGSNLGIAKLPSIIVSNKLCDLYGIDTISAGIIISFVMECVQRGYLTDKDIGVPGVVFGEDKIIGELLRMMSYQEGFGYWMSQGVYRLAQHVGQGSIRFAMQVKGLEFPGYDPRAGFGACLAYAVNPRGACHRKAWPPALEVLKGIPPYTTENKGSLIRELTNENNLLHSILVCDFPCKFIPFAGDEVYARFLTDITGESWTPHELQEGADRGELLARLFNYREGFRRSDDCLPARIFDDAAPQRTDVSHRITRADLEQMKDEYYHLRGLDTQGWPEERTLQTLGLEEYVEFVKRTRAEEASTDETSN